MRLYHQAVFLLLMSVSTHGFAEATTHSSDNILEEMFTWWNELMISEREITEESFASFYTENAVIIINGKEKVRGVKNMPAFFRENRDRTEFIEIEMPFREKFVSGNKIFTYHTIRAIRNGEEKISHNMGYALIEKGKISYVSLARFGLE
ncbi:MAG: hypothetical protein HN764_05645 [Gammaproteobacteria bacterium]|jgi:hypothetical protein|nr:hypothetical protein [Gammaproteobacteria bacterium]